MLLSQLNQKYNMKASSMQHESVCCTINDAGSLVVIVVVVVALAVAAAAGAMVLNTQIRAQFRM